MSDFSKWNSWWEGKEFYPFWDNFFSPPTSWKSILIWDVFLSRWKYDLSKNISNVTGYINWKIESLIWEWGDWTEFINIFNDINKKYRELLLYSLESGDNSINEDLFNEYLELYTKVYSSMNKEDVFFWNYLQNMDIISSFFNQKKNEYKDNIAELLKRCFIDYDIYQTWSLSKNEKDNIKLSIMVLYSNSYQAEKWIHDFERNKDFMREIDEQIDWYLDSDNVEFHFLSVRYASVVSSFFKEVSEWNLYWWWLNMNSQFAKSRIWFTFFEMLLNEKWLNNNLECTVTTEIEWKENNWYKGLLKTYGKFWFKEYWEWKTKYSKFIKLKREKTN